MSRRAVSGDLEGIDRISGRRRTNIGFQAVAAHHIDRTIKQTGNILFESCVIENRDVSLGINLDHNVGIAVRTVIAAYTRPEKSGMRDAALAQGGLVFPKFRKDFLSVHNTFA
jgi:hypothetical protein